MSWNVNGLRAVIKKGFYDFLDKYDPDILCLQEVKAMPEQVDLKVEGYTPYWNSAEKKGYSGTLTLTKLNPKSVKNGLGIKELDKEGRVITLEYEDFYIVNVYTPNAQRELTRLDYRVNRWDEMFRGFVAHLDESKPVIFCGDLNVAHKEIDLANPKTNTKNAGFTIEERSSFSKTLDLGFVDSFRHFNSTDKGHYSWWSYRPGVRQKNIGWRIDYFCASRNILGKIKNAAIHPEVLGSDHCPVSLEFFN